MGTLYERVVGVWDGEVGEAVGWAGGGCEHEFDLDVYAVGVLCQGLDRGEVFWGTGINIMMLMGQLSASGYLL